MKSYRTLALRELLAQRVTSVLILLAILLSTTMTAVIGQSAGVLAAMRQQQAIAIGGNRHAGFVQMTAEQVDALEQDKLAGAALDVFAKEPLANERVMNCPKISLTPHIGGSTKEAQGRIGEEIVEIIENFFQK